MTDDDFNKDDVVDGMLNTLWAMEIEDKETAVIWAVDATLRYVVDWLRSTGHAAKADILETLGDIDGTF